MKPKTWRYRAFFEDISDEAFGTVSAVNQQEATLLAYRTVHRQYPYLAIKMMNVRLLEGKGK